MLKSLFAASLFGALLAATLAMLKKTSVESAIAVRRSASPRNTWHWGGGL